MPLKKVCSVDAFRENIAAEIRAGRSPEQAAAIAHDTLRQACADAGQPAPRTDGIPIMTVKRYDRSELEQPERLDNGYLKCDARITRVGVFNYVNRDGSIRRELRLPDEVFNADSLRSFEDVALTNNHPPEPLTAKNTKRFHCGHVRDVRSDSPHVAARVTITDADAVKDAEKGKRQLSCGYNCDLELTQGVTSGIEGIPDGLRYDAIQRNIRGNHLAIVSKARAGADASLRLDADDRVMVEDTKPDPEPKPEAPKMKIKIDGVEFEIEDGPAAQAVQKVIARVDERDEQITKLSTELATEKARADDAEEKRDEAIKARDDAASPERIDQAVKNRVTLVENARKILGDKDKDGKEIKLDGKSDAEIKRDVVVHVSPQAAEKIDAMEGDAQITYLNARFDQAIESWKPPKGNKGLENVQRLTHDAGNADDPNRIDADEAHARMTKEGQERGRRPLGKQADAN
jgi:hypothetical protein